MLLCQINAVLSDGCVLNQSGGSFHLCFHKMVHCLGEFGIQNGRFFTLEAFNSSKGELGNKEGDLVRNGEFLIGVPKDSAAFIKKFKC